MRVAMDLVRGTEGDGKFRVIGFQAALPRSWKVAESMYKYMSKYILKFSNCVLVRVPIDNNNY